jgi:hypothetical protein
MGPVVTRMRTQGWLWSVPAAVAGSILLWAWTPSDDPAASICVWRRTTGVACPGCGMVRAAAQVAKGNLDAAFAYHPLVLLVAAQVGAAWAWWALWAQGRLRAPRPATRTLWLLANLVLLCVVWVVRAASGSLPP